MKPTFSSVLLLSLTLISSAAGAPPAPSENLEEFLGVRPKAATLTDVVRHRSADVGETVWSGHHWPLAKGGIARRYTDPSFPNSANWGVNFRYVQEVVPASRLVRRGDVDVLSPAEKYDLLLNLSPEWQFTARNWTAGERIAEDNPEIPDWLNLSHGSSAASVEFDRPINSVTVPAGNGRTSITFHPTDIKALASAYYASMHYETSFLGQRCNSSQPDRKSGACRDVNPASLHLALVNRIGVEGKSIIADTDTEEGIDNQVMIGYQYSFFNVRTGKFEESAEAARVAWGPWDEHRFRRAPGTRFLLGIRMSITYRLNQTILSRDPGSAASEPAVTRYYRYDLEIGRNDEILGGEWHQDDRPDFLWRVAERPDIASESTLPKWKMNRRLPSEWREAAQRQLRTNSAPLYSIIQQLIQASRN